MTASDKLLKEIFLNGNVTVTVGDITSADTDAIVNAANSTLLGGGGVDGAIHRIGGSGILDACKEIRRTAYPDGLPTGKAVITTAGNLPARYVIHTVGPIYGQNGDKDAELLAACYTNSLNLAKTHGLNSIAFPSISTGAFYFPKHEAAAVSSVAIKQFLLQDTLIREIRLVFFTLKDAEIFLKNNQF